MPQRPKGLLETNITDDHPPRLSATVDRNIRGAGGLIHRSLNKSGLGQTMAVCSRLAGYEESGEVLPAASGGSSPTGKCLGNIDHRATNRYCTSPVQRRLPTKTRIFMILLSALLAIRASGQEADSSTELLVSVADQQMALLRSGQLIAKFPISTSKFGLGDARNSYKTPLGRLRICEKIGDGLPAGTVLKGREATREVLPVNAPGRDPIVTRILWLEGLEEQNRNARARAIYIHGTPEESRLGEAVSWGCIRMRSRDVIALYDQVEEGTEVTITTSRLPKLRKYDSNRDIIVASHKPVRPEPPRMSSIPAPLPARHLLSELSVPSDTRALSGKGGAMDAMKGSILFSGIAKSAE